MTHVSPTKLIEAAIASGDPERLEDVIAQLAALKSDEAIDALNALLLDPNHRCHQIVARALQKIRSPSTIPFVRQVLLSDLSVFDYTCSESDVIAKWFSWLLADIGTIEAIDVIRESCSSPDPGIREEMRYRLAKVER